MAELLPFPPLPTESSPAPPPDAAARALALDISRSFIVEAPAGSGKTALLIQRYLKLLADPAVTLPEQVLAITFTNKATAELKDRILSHLESAAQNPPDPTAAPPPNPHDFVLHTRHIAQSVLARSLALGWDLLAQPHRLNIRTIDSVCSEISRTLPILSGSGGRLAPTLDPGPLHREAARRTLLLLGATSDPAFQAALRDLLLHRDANLPNCESLLTQMLALRDQWGSLIPLTRTQLDDAFLDTEILPRLEQALTQTIASTLTRLADAFSPDTLADLASLAGDLGHAAPSRPDTPSPLVACAGHHTPPEPIPAHLDRWLALIHLLTTADTQWRQPRGINLFTLKFAYDVKHIHHTRLTTILDSLRHRDDLLSLFAQIRTLPSATYPPDQWRVAKSLFRVLSRALVELQFVFASRNQCDFTELTLLARQALDTPDGPEDLARALGARLQHLLVDEMQDTSTPQYDLIQLLTASWDAHSQTVFLVGDPRQSIYLFRQARVERFLQTLHTRRLGDLRLTPLRLTANFRSQQRLVAQFNDTFTQIFPEPASSATDLPYQPVQSTLPPSPGSGADSEALHWHAAPDAPNPRHLQALQIRNLIRHWLNKPLPPGRRRLANGDPAPWTIAILVRNRSHLAEIVPALTLSDASGPSIPLRAVDINSLAERPEVLDLTALTRALLHPADRTAALALLRAPWCGLPLADLHALTGADPDSDDPALPTLSIPTLLDQRGHLLSEASIPRIRRLSQVLSHAQALRARLTPSQLVRHAWLSLGGDASLTQQELINTNRFFALLDELQAQVEISTSATLLDPNLLPTHLQKLFAEPDPAPTNSSYVDLLTIHKAKGLEWDLVIVPALDRIPAVDQSRLLTWAELDPTEETTATISSNPSEQALPEPALFDLAADAPAIGPQTHFMLAPIAGKGEQSHALTTWLRGIHTAREAAERKRLFYVAATRAREEVHLFAAPKPKASGHIHPKSTSLLYAAWPAAELHFPTAAPATAGSNILTFPAPDPNPVLDLAASADPIPRLRPNIQRLPTTFDPIARLTASPHLPYTDSPATHRSDEPDDPDAPLAPVYTRPEGSLAARAFGTAVHLFIQLLTNRIALGEPPTALLDALPTLSPRIAAVLRSHSLPPATVTQLTRETLAALRNLLTHPDGLWLLASYSAAGTELALTSLDIDPQNPNEIRPATTIRVDRTFRAGPEPHLPATPGSEFLWIVDYKTASHGPTGLAGFLAAQRSAYAPQLETYARILTQPTPTEPTPPRVRLALYFPTIPHLLWWPGDSALKFES